MRGSDRDLQLLLKTHWSAWGRDELKRIARAGAEVWNRAMEHWDGDLIDFSDAEFLHSFEGFVFKRNVSFERAIFKNSSFRWATFGDEKAQGGSCDPVNFKFKGATFWGDVSFEDIKIYNANFWFERLEFPVPSRRKFKIEAKESATLKRLSLRDTEFKSVEVHIEGLDSPECMFDLHVNSFEDCRRIRIVNISNVSSFYIVSNEFHKSALNCSVNSNIFDVFNNTMVSSPVTFSKVSVKNGYFRIRENTFQNNEFRLVGADVVAMGVELSANAFSRGARLQDCKFDLISDSDDGFGLGQDSIAPVPHRSRNIDFSNNDVRGQALFLNDCEFTGDVTFSGTSCEGALGFQNVKFVQIPDLQLTKIGAGFSLEGLEITGDEEEGGGYLSGRYRRFKELSIQSKDHERELEYFAKEMRTRRKYSSFSPLKLVSNLYDAFSDYGSCVVKPSISLFFLWFYSGWIIYQSSKPAGVNVSWDNLWLSLKLSGSILLPFLGFSRSVYTNVVEKLFGEEGPSKFVEALFLFEGLLGFVFLFLIGLALRNRFRL